MIVFKRVLGSTIVNGLLTALFCATPTVIYIALTPPQDSIIMIDGRYILLYASVVLGLIIGGVGGLLVGLLNTSAGTSALIGGFLFIIAGIFMVGRVPAKDEIIKVLLFILIPAVLSAAASGATARIFNKQAALQ